MDCKNSSILIVTWSTKFYETIEYALFQFIRDFAKLWHIRLFTNVIMLSAKLFPVVPRSAVIIHPVQSCSFELHNKAVLGFVFQWKPCRPFCEGADGGPRFQPSPFAFKDGVIRPDPKSSFMKFCNRDYLCY